MKLKLNADGSAEVVDGKPVYIHDDGTEVPFDAPQYMVKFQNVNNEAKNHRLKTKEVQDEFDQFKSQFEGIDLPAAKKALETVKALDDKDLIKASELENLKAKVAQEFQIEKDSLIKGHTKVLDEMKGQLEGANSTVRQMVLKDAFSNSSYFSGEEAKTVYAPWEAVEIFGKYFKVEGEGANARPIGYLNGEKITSRENFVDPANFDDAMQQILGSDQNRFNKILSTKGGGGGGGGDDHSHHGKQSVVKGDNQAFMANLADIAAGKVKVKGS